MHVLPSGTYVIKAENYNNKIKLTFGVSFTGGNEIVNLFSGKDDLPPTIINRHSHRFDGVSSLTEFIYRIGFD